MEGSAEEGFRTGRRWAQVIEDLLRDEVTPAVQRIVAMGEDPRPVLRVFVQVLRTVADEIDPDAHRG